MTATDAVLVADLTARLESHAKPATKVWWERYLRGVIGFRGVKMASIRAAVHTWWEANGLDALPASAQRELAYELIRQRLAEDKLAGILTMQEILLPEDRLTCSDLDDIASLFDAGAIADWNTCDWLCVRVLGPLAERGGCASHVLAWSEAADLWQKRAAIVAFVNLAPRETLYRGFRPDLLAAAAVVVRDQRRFAQTGVGWVVRELSRSDPAAAEAFVTEHLTQMSREAVRSATARLDPQERARLLELHLGR